MSGADYIRLAAALGFVVAAAFLLVS